MKKQSERVPKSIKLDGRQAHGGRYLVVIDGQKVYLPPKSFKYFVALSVGRQRGCSGWIHVDTIERGHRQRMYLWRLKQEILESIAWDWKVFSNNRQGYYRLNTEPESISLNLSNLIQFPDAELQDLLEGYVIE